MGRYITGDIETKLWVAVQSSDAADRFGVTGHQPKYLQYYFCEEDLPKVKKELKNIEETIGKDNLELLNNFFKDDNGYNDRIMKEYNENLPKIWEKHKEDYADYTLGKKIEECIKKLGECEFDAEM